MIYLKQFVWLGESLSFDNLEEHHTLAKRNLKILSAYLEKTLYFDLTY